MTEEQTNLLPKGEEKRKQLINILKEATKLELVKDSANDSLKDIKARAKEELEIKPADFGVLLKSWMDDTFAHEEYSKAEILLHTNEILRSLGE